MTSSCDISFPPPNAYLVSHHTHLSEQPVSRTNTHGLPTCEDSPWTLKNISVMRIAVVHELHQIVRAIRYRVVRQTGHEEFSIALRGPSAVEYRENSPVPL